MRLFILVTVFLQLVTSGFAVNNPTNSDEGNPKDKLKDTMFNRKVNTSLLQQF